MSSALEVYFTVKKMKKKNNFDSLLSD